MALFILSTFYPQFKQRQAVFADALSMGNYVATTASSKILPQSLYSQYKIEWNKEFFWLQSQETAEASQKALVLMEKLEPLARQSHDILFYLQLGRIQIEEEKYLAAQESLQRAYQVVKNWSVRPEYAEQFQNNLEGADYTKRFLLAQLAVATYFLNIPLANFYQEECRKIIHPPSKVLCELKILYELDLQKKLGKPLVLNSSERYTLIELKAFFSWKEKKKFAELNLEQ